MDETATELLANEFLSSDTGINPTVLAAWIAETDKEGTAADNAEAARLLAVLQDPKVQCAIHTLATATDMLYDQTAPQRINTPESIRLLTNLTDNVTPIPNTAKEAEQFAASMTRFIDLKPYFYEIMARVKLIDEFSIFTEAGNRHLCDAVEDFGRVMVDIAEILRGEWTILNSPTAFENTINRIESGVKALVDHLGRVLYENDIESNKTSIWGKYYANAPTLAQIVASRGAADPDVAAHQQAAKELHETHKKLLADNARMQQGIAQSAARGSASDDNDEVDPANTEQMEVSLRAVIGSFNQVMEQNARLNAARLQLDVQRYELERQGLRARIAMGRAIEKRAGGGISARVLGVGAVVVMQLASSMNTAVSDAIYSRYTTPEGWYMTGFETLQALGYVEAYPTLDAIPAWRRWVPFLPTPVAGLPWGAAPSYASFSNAGEAVVGAVNKFTTKTIAGQLEAYEFSNWQLAIISLVVFFTFSSVIYVSIKRMRRVKEDLFSIDESQILALEYNPGFILGTVAPLTPNQLPPDPRTIPASRIRELPPPERPVRRARESTPQLERPSDVPRQRTPLLTIKAPPSIKGSLRGKSPPKKRSQRADPI